MVLRSSPLKGSASLPPIPLLDAGSRSGRQCVCVCVCVSVCVCVCVCVFAVQVHFVGSSLEPAYDITKHCGDHIQAGEPPQADPRRLLCAIAWSGFGKSTNSLRGRIPRRPWTSPWKACSSSSQRPRLSTWDTVCFFIGVPHYTGIPHYLGATKILGPIKIAIKICNQVYRIALVYWVIQI